MKTSTLVISDSLIEPPSETWAFRNVTMLSHENLHMSVLLHTTQELKDRFYHWMKQKGAMDFVDYIISENEWEDGIRIDTIGIYPRCIVVKYIRLENQIFLFGKIKALSEIE
jgi:hypothetical protein